MPRPSSQWELVMDSITEEAEEISESSSQGTLSSQRSGRTLTHKFTTTSLDLKRHATTSSTRSTISNSALLSSFPQPPSVDALHAASTNARKAGPTTTIRAVLFSSDTNNNTPTARSRGSRPLSGIRRLRLPSRPRRPPSPSTSTAFGITAPADAPSSSALYPALSASPPVEDTACRMSLEAARTHGHDALCGRVVWVQ
ncbi:hypothetical protein C8J57DRAFT_1704723 [Mycena rebaudengoi]|nr:hypothetical protein C8J57DRAFT_1704723 [Mycena rebaudengoi]